MTLTKKVPLWVFNGLMIWGALLGSLIYHTTGKLIDTARHQGPGIVNYGEDGEFPKTVTENQFKRHNFTMYGALLLGELSVWVWLASTARAKDRLRNSAGHGT